jgi:hypothetical protein
LFPPVFGSPLNRQTMSPPPFGLFKTARGSCRSLASRVPISDPTEFS